MPAERIEQIPIDDLVCLPQVRERTGFGDEEITGLAQSIRETGCILQPLLVRRDGNLLVVLDGERRLRAARLAGLTHLPVIIEKETLSAEKILHRQLVLDAQRVGLSPMERAKAIGLLMKESGWSAREVAVKLGVSPANVSKLLALTVLPADVQTAVANGKVGMSTAYELAKLPDVTERQRLCEKALAGELTRGEVLASAKGPAGGHSRQRAPRPRVVRDRVVFKPAKGCSIAVTASSLTVETLSAWISRLAAEITRVAGGVSSPAEAAELVSRNMQQRSEPTAIAIAGRDAVHHRE